MMQWGSSASVYKLTELAMIKVSRAGSFLKYVA